MIDHEPIEIEIARSGNHGSQILPIFTNGSLEKLPSVEPDMRRVRRYEPSPEEIRSLAERIRSEPKRANARGSYRVKIRPMKGTNDINR